MAMTLSVYIMHVYPRIPYISNNFAATKLCYMLRRLALASSTALGIAVYYEHRRLLALYPTLRIPPSLEISARRDKPAFGMTGSGAGEAWMRTHAGDMWVATIPRRLLTSTSTSDDQPLITFARAFWSSWPLQIERRIVGTLARLGILFGIRGTDVGAEGESRFVERAKILGGLFVVEAHDTTPNSRTQGPLVTSWWLRPVEGPTVRAGLLGGYHSFAVEDNPSKPKSEEEPTARLCFVSHLIMSSPSASSSSIDTPMDSASIPSSELHGLSLRQNVIMHFHTFYARWLLDLAVRDLQRGRE
ncbi:hypothetical protein C8R44DRAFT_881006 [Mycena epipterygia]|nr:hypothetical protein C8R44DRAFT_881006 [Mycena epipterygia]